MQKRLRFTKRTLALALVLVMAVGILPMAGAASDYEDHWSKEYIDDAVSRGWMKGYEDGSFKPESSITRAEFAVMLWRAYGEPAGGANPFTDVPNGEWYDDATAALYELGITSGVGGGQYDPNGTLTREMGMTMLARAFGIEAEDAESYKSFSDASQISDWATAAVSALVEKGYAQGLGDGQFAPHNPLKRGEMARILTVVFDGEGGVPETEGGDESITITLSHSPKINTSGNVTVTVTAESENGSITYIGMRKSSVGATYADKSDFTDITAASRFTVSDNGWYAVCAEDEQGAFAYKLINITNISRGSSSSPDPETMRVVIRQSVVTLSAGQTVQLEAVVDTDGATLTWSKPAGTDGIVTLGADGTVTAVAGGTVTITVTAKKDGYNDATATCVVKVKSDATAAILGTVEAMTTPITVGSAMVKVTLTDPTATKENYLVVYDGVEMDFDSAGGFWIKEVRMHGDETANSYTASPSHRAKVKVYPIGDIQLSPADFSELVYTTIEPGKVVVNVRIAGVPAPAAGAYTVKYDGEVMELMGEYYQIEVDMLGDETATPAANAAHKGKITVIKHDI